MTSLGLTHETFQLRRILIQTATGGSPRITRDRLSEIHREPSKSLECAPANRRELSPSLSHGNGIFGCQRRRNPVLCCWRRHSTEFKPICWGWARHRRPQKASSRYRMPDLPQQEDESEWAYGCSYRQDVNECSTSVCHDITVRWAKARM